MGKKGSWFSKIKRVFTPHSKEKLSNEAEKKSGKEKKKKGFGKLRSGEPSSIEKIFGEAERDHNLVFRLPTPLDQSNPSSSSPLRPASPRVASPPEVSIKSPSPRPTSPRVDSSRLDSSRPPSPRLEAPTATTPRPPPSPKAVSPRTVQRHEIVSTPEPTLSVQHASATKIQAAFRGYTAKRSLRARKGHNVKQQTVNAMKYMQQLVRVQSQVQSRRIKTLGNQAHVEKDEAASEAGNDNWDDSVLTKEERDVRSQRKIDAIIKRERSMAYAHSHKVHGSKVPISTSRYSRGRLRTQDSTFKDDDSFTSCPPFPRYMAPTVSAKAKVRPNSNPKERVMGLDMFRWNKGSLHMSSHKGPGSPGGVVLEKHNTLKSVENLSIDTAVSMPATVGRRPFNRYV